MASQDDILTISEVSKLAEKTVYSLAQKGELQAIKVGNQGPSRRMAIDSWIEARTKADGAQPAYKGAKTLHSGGRTE